MKFGSRYFLVLGKNYWEDVPESGGTKEFAGQFRWRIDGRGPIRVLFLNKAAIRYVAEIYNKSANLTIRDNADKTLAILSKLKE
ncbi:MAG: hypothetical protein WA020_06210 [Candidatus Acidiferrales bacterium]